MSDSLSYEQIKDLVETSADHTSQRIDDAIEEIKSVGSRVWTMNGMISAVEQKVDGLKTGFDDCYKRSQDHERRIRALEIINGASEGNSGGDSGGEGDDFEQIAKWKKVMAWVVTAMLAIGALIAGLVTSLS